MSSDLQQKIGQGLEPISSPYGQMALSPWAEIIEMPTSFLVNYHLYQITYRAPKKPTQFYVGYAENKPLYLITGQPETYFTIAEADHIQLDSTGKALQYVTLYLTVSRPMNKIFYVISNTDQIIFRPNLETDEQQARSAFLKKYTDIINHHTAVQADDQQYIVTVYVIRAMTLELHKIMVNRAGQLLNSEITVLEKDLPLVYGM